MLRKHIMKSSACQDVIFSHLGLMILHFSIDHREVHLLGK
jgi:hypothetical protein